MIVSRDTESARSRFRPSPSRRALLGVVALALAICTVRVAAPEPPDGRDPHAAWAANLERFVDAEGRIDFDGMAAEPADLEAYVAWIAEVSPESAPRRFPGRADALAYWVNAYNALAMYNVLHADSEPENTYRFFYVRELLVGGRYLSLSELENDVIRPLGDERVHFALNCMVRSCPRLPREPFRPERLDEQLDAAAREFFRSPEHARVEDGAVVLSKILDWYEEDFLAVAPSLVAYANRWREAELPADARVRFAPYDWTLNRQ